MLKLLGMLTLAGAVTAFGFSLSSRFSEKRKFLEQLVCFFEMLQELLRYTADGYEKLFFELSKREELSQLSFLKLFFESTDKDLHKKWRSAVSRCENALLLGREEQERLDEFGAAIGKSDVEGEISRCRLYALSFRESLEKAKEEESKKGRLYRSMSLLAAAAVVILVF